MKPLAVFDLDDTLVDYAGAIDRALVAFALERMLGDEGLKFLREVNIRAQSVDEAWQSVRSHFRFEEDAHNLAMSFAEMVPKLTVPFEGVGSGLRALRGAGWRLALLTNGVERDQKIKIADHFDDLFEVSVFCDDSGPRKPDPVAFNQVTYQAGVDPKDAWMVGDSLLSDIAGASAVGMTTLWISRGRSVPDDGPKPDHVASSVDHAFRILRDVV